ncbi:succinate dehydrogenase, cytochrome b556 subunit [Ehrlichia chaffeensis str. Arkansas]|uniref:Succinate dehydrogenase cytochrome b556 subunit n=2 Tax=Ehrlichia chaffeensis TaxID=945 RepID=Q2GFS4_EHRCR|nr:succinate dehydrogenase, cytochrome b556 subunit [Ehrlichia chaffeensis]AAL60178.1 succinate dehydrogenase subunit C [Ehrlichia chaffeensis]ABD45320.1 succinate dehydrogenase, cytochrome b556 subunit [Ehrlichia chaffeensis str. Arkansas]
MSKVRPLSPHLQIYKVVYKLSIMHRFTGMILFLGLLVLSWGFILSFLCPQVVYRICSFFCNSYVSLYSLKLITFIWLNVLCYHYMNGIRHIFWDLGLGLSKSAVRTTGVVVVFLCLVSSFILYSFFLS